MPTSRRVPAFLLAGLLCSTLTAAAPPDRFWRIEGDTLSPAPVEVRGDDRGVVEHGVRLAGRTTPFVVAPRVDELDGGLPTEAITLEAWVAIDEPRQWGGIVGAIQDNGEAESGVLLGYRDGFPAFAIAGRDLDDPDGRLTYLTASRPFVPGRWHHLVGTYDGAVMRLFMDGESVAESRDQSGPIRFVGDEPLAIGGYLDRNEDHGLTGRLAEVSILGRALSEAEIARRFAARADLAALPPVFDTTMAWRVEPYLCWPATDAMSIAAETTRPTAMELRVRDERGDFRTTLRHDDPATLHVFRVEGLEPNTKYFYRLVAEGSGGELVSDQRTFRSAAAAGDPFTFVAIGDTQTRPAVAKRVADLAYETRPNLLVHAGDLVDTGRDKRHWTDMFFPSMQPLIGRVPIMPVLGNHEQDATHYYDHFDLPEPERWYSFRYGDAEFFMLDGNRSLAEQSEQLAWLESALAASEAEWKFAVLHQPPWTSDSDDYGDTYRTGSLRGDSNARNIVSLLERHGVDICFSGHVHDYERTFPILDGDVVPWDEGGVVYVTTAGGGGSLEDFDPANTPFGHRKAHRHHFVYVAIHDGILEFQAMDEDGRLFDVMTLDKRDGRRTRARAARFGVEIAPRSSTWRDSPAD